jgi:hypothetical protein
MGSRIYDQDIWLAIAKKKAFVWASPALAAAAGASALHAAVAGTVSCHDGSAGGAAWRVAHVVHALHGVGGVIDSAVFHGERAGCGRVGWVGGDSLFGWGGGVGFLGCVRSR